MEAAPGDTGDSETKGQSYNCQWESKGELLWLSVSASGGARLSKGILKNQKELALCVARRTKMMEGKKDRWWQIGRDNDDVNDDAEDDDSDDDDDKEPRKKGKRDKRVSLVTREDDNG